MFKSAVIDCASLIYLSHLHQRKPFFHFLSSLFHTLYFPSEVVNEYARGAAAEPHRQWILDRLKPEQGFYRHCNTYDSVSLAFVVTKKGFDKGEAESYAQYTKVNAHILISDDKPFTIALAKMGSGIRVYSTLHLICWLDLLKYIPDWEQLVREIHRIRPFDSSELRNAYLEVARQLDLVPPKKVISAKCSLSRIL